MPRCIFNSCAALLTSIWEVCYEAHGRDRYVCFEPAGSRREVPRPIRRAPGFFPPLWKQEPASDNACGGETVPGCSADGTGNLATQVWNAAGLLFLLALSRKAEYSSHATYGSEVHADLCSIYLLPSGDSAVVGGRSALPAEC